MAAEGAAIIDVGGQSTRPVRPGSSAQPVMPTRLPGSFRLHLGRRPRLSAARLRQGAPRLSAAEEMWRIEPVLSGLRAALGGDSGGGPLISIDTFHSEARSVGRAGRIESLGIGSLISCPSSPRLAQVAAAAAAAGAHIVNDVSAGGLDGRMARTAAELRCAFVLSHMRGDPATMQSAAHTAYGACGIFSPFSGFTPACGGLSRPHRALESRILTGPVPSPSRARARRRCG